MPGSRKIKPLVIYGAGGQGRETLQLVEDCNAARESWKVVSFCSNDARHLGMSIRGIPVREWHEVAEDGMAVVIAIGRPSARRRACRDVRQVARAAFPAMVHPEAHVGAGVTLGEGVVLADGAILAVDITVGAFALVNRQCSVGHDCRLDDYATLAPRVVLGGDCEIGVGAEIGAGAVLNPGARVGDWSVIGSGAVVLDAVPANATSVGVPAAVRSMRTNGWEAVE
jgi:sugar O-acyltransferase (sialic acid O-acetyltransferase NeuD family)